MRRVAGRLIWFGMEPRGRVRHLVVGSNGTPACGQEASDNMRYGWHNNETQFEWDTTVLSKPLCVGCRAALVDFNDYLEKYA